MRLDALVGIREPRPSTDPPAQALLAFDLGSDAAVAGRGRAVATVSRRL